MGLSQQKNEEEEEEKIRRSRRFSERYYIHYGEGELANISLKVPKLDSLDILAKVVWRQCRVLGSEKGNVMGRGLLECTTE